MIAKNNILFLTEGKSYEQDIFANAVKKYGLTSIPIKQRIIDLNIGKFEEFNISIDGTQIFIIQGPRNRIHDFLKYVSDPNIDLEKIFGYEYAFFQKIFLIYDVDHNDCEDVTKMYELFQDESTGMLLLSSPCIEVLADFNRKRGCEKYSRLSEYKSEINNHYNGHTKEYINENFDEIMLFFLEKNYKDFKENNIMEHPRLIIDKINQYNERVNCKDKKFSYVIYRYFSTVVYVAIANALSLTKDIDNYDKVRNFFLNQIKEKRELDDK